jgi:hypothetical protein
LYERLYRNLLEPFDIIAGMQARSSSEN